MKRYYFIDREIYFEGNKLPNRKVELFNVEINGEDVYANDTDCNIYCIDISDLIIEEE